jgi:hypothetical protein
VRVSEQIIEHPEAITIQQIQEENNAEVRRVLIERYGLSRYLVDSRAKKIAEDGFGELYRSEIPNDQPLVMVKVVNSTPEPDGSGKPYFLRVHPEVRPLLSKGEELASRKTTHNGWNTWLIVSGRPRQSGCKDGANPVSGLVQATNGDFYGTTATDKAGGLLFGGRVFKITPGGTLTTRPSCSRARHSSPLQFPQGR